jgi:AhpD family alkylhydroperoxidase
MTTTSATPVSHTPRLSVEPLAPESYRAMVALDGTVTKGPLEAALQELIRVRASQINGCAYCLAMHTNDARQGGESEQRLYALSAWRESPWFTARERAALAMTDAITRISDAGVPDDVYDEAALHFTPAEVAALIMAINVINAWNRIAITTRLLPDVGP